MLKVLSNINIRKLYDLLKILNTRTENMTYESERGWDIQDKQQFSAFRSWPPEMNAMTR